MGLTLVVGPANAGKVALLLERYLEELEREPVLIVPNRSDVERVERELVALRPCVFGGFVGTFDDLFTRIARGGDAARPVAGDAQHTLLLRRAVSRAHLNGLGASARSAGFVESLRAAVRELEEGLVDPNALEGDVGALYRAYRDELDALGLWDRQLVRAHAVQRLASELDAWSGEPVFAYGFEDLTAAEWGLVQALAGRTDVTVTLPYEPGRTAFAALQRTADDLGRLASKIEELPPRYADVAQPAIAYLERNLFGDAQPEAAPPLEGAIRFFEGAGTRGALELVAEEILALARSGVALETIGVVCPSLERLRAPLTTAFSTLGVPFGIESPIRFAQTPFGHALLALVRFAWSGGDRGDLFAFLRSPYSGLTRASVDFVEGRLRGRAITAAERVEEEMLALRGVSLPTLDALRAAGSPLDAVRALSRTMLRAAYGLERPPVGEEAALDLRSHEACSRLVEELEAWERLVGPLSADDVVAALERLTVRGARSGEPGRVAVVDLERARTRRLDVVFVLGLEEGSLPRRSVGSPLLDEDLRDRLGPRLHRVDPVVRDRYLFYTACTRPTRRLYLVRESASDEGSPREASAFWDEVVTLFPAEEVDRATTRRPLSHLTWQLHGAPTERERLRALASLTSQDEAEADGIARANGWERRLERARTAFRRETRLRHPLVLEQLRARTTFNVTELERMADCSAAWFVERFLDPRAIDQEPDAKLRGSVAHTTLNRFFSGLPKEIGSDRVTPERLDDALRFMRACLDQALEGVRLELTPMQRRELQQGLWRDLEQLVHDEAASESPLVPSRFEVGFGTERSTIGGLDLGGGLSLSGKIDRIDVDPFSARGIVQDYKAGKGAHSARSIERELRLQIPLYMLVLRDLVGIEPLGGVYRPLAGDRKARGLLRAGTHEDAIPGFVKTDYVAEEDFWRQVEGARETARGLAERIRSGDVQHDPRGGECPQWCDLWPMCRVAKA